MKYKHMGTQFASGAKSIQVLPEIQYRWSTLVVDLQPLKRKVIHNVFVPVEDKVSTVQIKTFSKLLYNAGTWPSLNGAEMKSLSTKVYRLYRMIITSPANHPKVYMRVIPDDDYVKMANAHPVTIAYTRRHHLQQSLKKLADSALFFGPISTIVFAFLADDVKTLPHVTFVSKAFAKLFGHLSCRASRMLAHHSVSQQLKELTAEVLLNDQQVLESLKVAQPKVLLIVARLRLFLRVAVVSSSFLLSVLAAAAPARRSWLSSLSDDLLWLNQHAPTSVFSDSQSTSVWFHRFRQSPKYWRKQISSLLNRDDLRLLSSGAAPSAQDDEHTPFICPECGHVEYSNSALQSHRFSSHRICTPIRYHLSGTACANCLTEFFSYHRLLEHTHRVQRCKDFYINHVPPLNDEQFAEQRRISAREYQESRSSGISLKTGYPPAFSFIGPYPQHAS